MPFKHGVQMLNPEHKLPQLQDRFSQRQPLTHFSLEFRVHGWLLQNRIHCNMQPPVL